MTEETRTGANRSGLTVDRVFGDHEAAAMFSAIDNALALVGTGGEFLAELRAERALLVAHRKALARLLGHVRTENFNRPARSPEMSSGLRAAIRYAEEVLDG